MAKTVTGNTHTYNGGKFHYQVIFTESSNSVEFEPSIQMENVDGKKSKFNSKVTFKFTWNGNNGGTDTRSGDAHVGYIKSSPKTIEITQGKAQVTLWVDDKYKETLEFTLQNKLSQPALSVNKVNDNKYEITVSGKGTASLPVREVHIERQDNDGSWSEITGSPKSVVHTDTYSETFTDTSVSAGNRYRYRAYTVSGDYQSPYASSEFSYTRPNTNQTITVNEVLGVRTLTWHVDSMTEINSGSITAWIVEVEENGSGIFLPIGIVPANALQYTYFWIHIPIKGTTSRYRLVAIGNGGRSIVGGDVTSEYYAAPSKPQKVEAYKMPNYNVAVNITDSRNNTAQGMYIERSVDGGTWTEVYAGDVDSTWVDSTLAGEKTAQYRVKYDNEKGSTDWTVSNIVGLLSKPNPPTLLSPYNGAVYNLDTNSLTFTWLHNSTDGSPQRSAILQYSVDDVPTTVELDDEDSYTLSLTEFYANDVISWKVRTQGSFEDDEDDGYSDWPSEWTITLLKKPQLAITSPQNSDVISELPVVVSYTYNDESGELAQIQIDILKNEEVVDTFIPQLTDRSYSLAGFLFDNESDYQIVVSAMSTSGLSDSQSVAIYVSYGETSNEGSLIPSFTSDEDGKVHITLTQDITEDSVAKDIVEAYVYRNYLGEKTLVAEYDGSEIIDMYAPLNVQYSYEVLQLTDEGEVILTTYDYSQNSLDSFIYYGDIVFRGRWNPAFDTSFSTPSKVRKYYAGRSRPVSYNGMAREKSQRGSFVLVDRSERDRLERIMEAGGRGIWKSADGDTFYADIEVGYNINSYFKVQAWNVELNIVRIDNEISQQ